MKKILGKKVKNHILKTKHYNCFSIEIFALTELEEKKWQKIPASRRWLELRRRQKLAKAFRGSQFLKTVE